MSKAFNINFQAKNIPTFEQEDELIAGEAISVENNEIFNFYFNFYSFSLSCLMAKSFKTM